MFILHFRLKKKVYFHVDLAGWDITFLNEFSTRLLLLYKSLCIFKFSCIERMVFNFKFVFLSRYFPYTSSKILLNKWINKKVLQLFSLTQLCGWQKFYFLHCFSMLFSDSMDAVCQLQIFKAISFDCPHAHYFLCILLQIPKDHRRRKKGW